MAVVAARFIQPGVIENRICECAPSQRGRVGVIFESKKKLGGTPAARRRLAGSYGPKLFYMLFVSKQNQRKNKFLIRATGAD